MKAQMCLQV